MLIKKITGARRIEMNNSVKKISLVLFLVLFNLAFFSPVFVGNEEVKQHGLNQDQDLIVTNTDFMQSIIILLTLTMVVTTALIALYFKMNTLKKNLQDKDTIISNLETSINNLNTNLSNILLERELQLKEIHHRIKNNLQIIISMLRVQAKEGTQINDVNYFVEKSQTRILSIALVHQNLCENENLNNIDYQIYLKDMCKNLNSILNVSNKKIRFYIKANGVFFALQTASTLGLIFNELISNSFKHAFANENEGTIKITIVKSFDKEFKITYSDNGIGLPTDKKTFHKSLGLELIELGTKQLNGKLVRKNTKNGLDYQIIFNETA